jgi:hypothetical protein
MVADWEKLKAIRTIGAELVIENEPDQQKFLFIIEALRQHARHAGVVSVCCTHLCSLSASVAETKRLLGDLV